MFRHVKELQFDARVSGPDPAFAKLLLEQFGGGNGELKAAMQYFCQSFTCRHAYPQIYDLLMDIATEEFSHLEIVGATITMLLEGVNGELKNAAEKTVLANILKNKTEREELVHQAATSPAFLVLSGGGPVVTDSNGYPWNGNYVNANGDPTVDLRSDIAAESRAKIVYEYLIQFTDDPHVKESLGFLMTREVSHMQMFTAALDNIKENFPPGVLEGDPRVQNVYFNMSNGVSVRGPWNQGQGPWPKGEEWIYVEEPTQTVTETKGLKNMTPEGTKSNVEDVRKLSQEKSKVRSTQVKSATPTGESAWCTYPQDRIEAPSKLKKVG
jgi:Mn-containing catalase